jgi:hypothetical protein
MMMWRERDCVQKLRYVQIGRRPGCHCGQNRPIYGDAQSKQKEKPFLRGTYVFRYPWAWANVIPSFEILLISRKPNYYVLYEASGHPHSNTNVNALTMGIVCWELTIELLSYQPLP